MFNIVTEKKCSKCGETKPLRDFVTNKACRDGYEGSCKKCQHAYQKSYRQKNASSISESRKIYQKVNKARIQQQHREYREKNREYINNHAKEYRKANPNKMREQDLMSEFGMTLAQYDEMFQKQGGVCAICGKSPETEFYGKLHVDHDHKSGKVRGLLCSGCNTALGRVKDNVNVLQKAIEYLLRFCR